MNRKKLSTWAKEQGVHYRTALAWIRDGQMPVRTERTPGGHIRVVEENPCPAVPGRCVLYARVSSSDQREDLQRQADRLRAFAAGRGWSDVEVVTEVGSGLNGHRRALLRLLADRSVQTVAVEHGDRLIVVEAGEQKLDIVQDFIDVVTSMCARTYGRRAAANRAKRALAAAAEDEP